MAGIVVALFLISFVPSAFGDCQPGLSAVDQWHDAAGSSNTGRFWRSWLVSRGFWAKRGGCSNRRRQPAENLAGLRPADWHFGVCLPDDRRRRGHSDVVRLHESAFRAHRADGSTPVWSSKLSSLIVYPIPANAGAPAGGRAGLMAGLAGWPRFQVFFRWPRAGNAPRLCFAWRSFARNLHAGFRLYPR